MSEGVETSQAPVSEDAEPSTLDESLAAGPQPEAAPKAASQAAAEFGLEPPPIPRLTKAQKASLLPPPPRVKSRYGTRKEVAPLPAAAQSAAKTTQSAVEQGVAPGENEAHSSTQRSSDRNLDGLKDTAQAKAADAVQGQLDDEALAAQEPLEEAPESDESRASLEHTLAPQVDFPEDVSEHLPEHLQQVDQDQQETRPLESPAPATQPNRDALAPGASRPRPAFQSALNSQAATESSNRTKVIFAVVGLLVLAALCWWQLGGA